MEKGSSVLLWDFGAHESPEIFGRVDLTRVRLGGLVLIGRETFIVVLFVAEARVELRDRPRRVSLRPGERLREKSRRKSCWQTESVGLVGICIEGKRSGVGPAAASNVKER